MRLRKETAKFWLLFGSGNKNGAVAYKLLEHGISGFEFASGIPGTIGGAIKMNAGAYGKEMKDIVVSSKVMDFEGNISELNLEEHEFEYRKSVFSKKNYVILESIFHLENGEKSEIEKKMMEYRELRKQKQPIDKPSAGSTFKRGEDFITAQLIDECGLKGMQIGGARVSDRHAGFIVNEGNASARDILELVEHVKKVVFEKMGKNIEMEIEVIRRKVKNQY